MAWQTRLICSFIAQTIPLEQGQENLLLKAALEISLEPRSPSVDRTDDISSERPAPVKYASPHALAQFAKGLAGQRFEAW